MGVAKLSRSLSAELFFCSDSPRSLINFSDMNLLFDLDGTLANPFKGFRNSIHFAFVRHQLEPPEDSLLRKCIGPPLHKSLPEILKVSPSLLNSVLQAYREHHEEKGIYEYEFYEGAEEALQKILSEKAHKLFVATSKPHAMAKPLLKHFGFEPYFNRIYGSELDGRLSTKADLIRHLLREEQLDPANTVMIGDRMHDAVGAKANGIKVFGVLWGYGSAEELTSANVDGIFENWTELKKHFLS